MKSVIYETKGRAREFNELAINLFAGCGHACVYCYGADVTHTDKERFINEPKPRVTPEDIQRSAEYYSSRGEKRSILLCFVTDPYQPIEAETKLTRTAIEILHCYHLRVTLLTKGGKRAMRDFDLLKSNDAFATTLTLANSKDSAIWEPGAAPPEERILSLKEAHKLGIETWVSLEPVVYLFQTLELIRQTMDFVDHYKVGAMNYHPHSKTIDWCSFGWEIKDYMDRLGVNYKLKKDLKQYMGIV